LAYDDASRLTEARNGTGAQNTNIISDVTREYDAAGRLTLDQQAVNGLTAKSVNYVTYDYDGKLTRMNVTGPGYDYTFSYDLMGRFEKILPTGGGTAFQYYYDVASNETERRNFMTNPNLQQIYTPDSLNRMSRLDVKKAITPPNAVAAEVYTYDRMSRLTVADRWPENKRDVFGYYLDGEMYWAQYGVTGPELPEGGDPDEDMPDTTDPWANWSGDPEAEGVPPPEDRDEPPPPPPPVLMLPAARTVAYSYDRAGNRSGMNDDGIPTWYTTNNLNQYIGATGQSLSNGSEHEISAHNGVSYYYINDERLKQVTSGSNNYYLYYDALGRCVKRKRNNVTTYYIYDGEKPILEYNSAGSLVGRNLYGKGIDEILMRAYGAIPTYYFQQDRNGNVTHLTNASGAIVEKYKYDAFGAVTVYDGQGNLLTNGTAYNNRFLFTGREYAATYAGTYTPAFTFYEYRARAYNPTLGRFMSEDPKGFDAGDYNLFRYCHNDPLDLTDPMGLDPGDPFTSRDDAANDATRFINPTSIRENAEYGFVLYRGADGSFYSSKPFTNGAGNRVNVGAPNDKSRIPNDAQRVGDGHTHGDYSRPVKDPKTGKMVPQRVGSKREDEYDSDHFSGPDKTRAENAAKKDKDYRTYLGTPSRDALKYNPATRREEKLPERVPEASRIEPPKADPKQQQQQPDPLKGQNGF
jgi:RHS repeat-associated protein